MKCPICEIGLNITERVGIEIDYCEKCKGVWLNRDELDQIIERSTSFQQPTEYNDRNSPQRGFPNSDRHYKKKNHNSLHSELFDY